MQSANEHLLVAKSQYYIKCLKKELDAFKYIKVPTRNTSMTREEFIDWALELLSHKELVEVVSMIENAKRRSSNIRPILEVIAAGITTKQASYNRLHR